MTKILEFQLQHQSFQWVFRVNFPYNWLVWSPCCLRSSQESFQHRSSKASMFQHSIFFTVQLLQLYVTTGKTIALTIWTFVSRVMSLLFNALSRFITPFLPRSKCLLIPWLTVTTCSDFSAQEEEICHCLHLFPLYLPGSNGARCHDFHLFQYLVLSLSFTLLLHLHQEAP